MTIETKYNVGEEVYIIANGTLRKLPITNIWIDFINQKPRVIYTFGEYSKNDYYQREEQYITKDI